MLFPQVTLQTIRHVAALSSSATVVVTRPGADITLDVESGQPALPAEPLILYSGPCFVAEGPFRVAKNSLGDEHADADARIRLPAAVDLTLAFDASQDSVQVRFNGVTRIGRLRRVQYLPAMTWLYVDWTDEGAFL